MINKLNIKNIFIELDNALKEQNLLREFTVFGSGALLIQNLSSKDRATLDIDMLDPEIDPELQIISMGLAKKLGLEVSWLNSAGYIFSKNFPEGWKDRLVPVYKGANLTVRSLSKKDLIASKILSYCQRRSNTDLLDLKSLKPSSKDFITAKKWLSQRPDYTEIEGAFKNLTTQLELKDE